MAAGVETELVSVTVCSVTPIPASACLAAGGAARGARADVTLDSSPGSVLDDAVGATQTGGSSGSGTPVKAKLVARREGLFAQAGGLAHLRAQVRDLCDLCAPLRQLGGHDCLDMLPDFG